MKPRPWRLTLWGMSVGALAASWTTAVTLPSLLVAVAMLALAIPATLGLFRRALLGFMAYQIGLVTLATLVAPTGWAHHPRLLSSILLVIAGAILARRGGRLALQPLMVSGDCSALMLALGTLTVVAAPQIVGDLDSLIQRLSFGVDNANHLNLARAIQRAQRFVYEQAPPGLGAGNETYPQGLAFAAGYTTWLIRGGTNMPRTADFVHDMTFAMHLLFASTVLFSAFVLQAGLPALVVRERLRKAYATAGVVVAAFVAAGPLLFLQAFGFQTQILAFGAILALLWIIMEKGLQEHPHLVVLLAAGCMMMVGQSWYVLLPVPASVVLLWVVRRRTDLRLGVVSAAGAVAVVGLYPMVNGPGVGQSALDGAVQRLSIPGVLLIVALAALTMVRYRGAFVRDQHSYALVALATSACLTGGLGLYQLVTRGTLTYYFWKALYLPVLLLVILAAAGLGAAPPSGREARRIFLSGLAAAWLLTAGTAAHFVRGVDGPAAGETVASALAMYPAPLPPRLDVVATSRCDRREEVHTSWWLAALLLDWPPDRRTLDEDGARGPEAIRRYALRHPDQQIVAFVDGECEELSTLSDEPLPNLELRPG